MNVNERIKKVRKRLQLTQEIFSSRIDLSRNFIAQIESGAKTPSDRTLKDICREFSVNEDWLRTGAGGDENMFIPDDARKYLDIGKAARTPNEFRDFLVQVMSTLPDEYCDYLYAEFKRFSEQHESKKGE